MVHLEDIIGACQRIILQWIWQPHSMNKTTPIGIDGIFEELFLRNKNLQSRRITISDECVYEQIII